MSVRERFPEAVAAIDAGDAAGLRRLLIEWPTLARTRLDGSEEWARAACGDSIDGYFARPYLLWFVAENPTRTGRCAPNAGRLAGLVVEAARRDGADLGPMLDVALGLVISGRVPRESGVQRELIDVLIDAGADPGDVLPALAARNYEAARRLIERGAAVPLAASICLGLPETAVASDEDRSDAMVAAALNGDAEGVRRLLARGVDPNGASRSIHPHAPALHHAVASGSLDCVIPLVEAGADLGRRDQVYGGTPLVWAEHLGFAEIAEELRRRTP